MQLTRLSLRMKSYFLAVLALTISFPVTLPCSFAQTPSSPASAAPAQNSAPAVTLPTSAGGAQGASAPAPAAGGPMVKPSLPPAIDPKTMTPLYETIQEDWSSLDIGTSRLQPEPPLVAQVEDKSDYTRSLVQVKWRPGDPIDLWITVPKGVTKPPVVLYLYGADQGTARFRGDAWTALAIQGGVAAVGFVPALTGPRFHDRPMKQWFISELQESVGSSVHDVKFILDYLAQRGDVDMSRVAMFGEGFGGTIAILAAAADSRIKVVDTLEPWGDWPDFLAKSPIVRADPKHDDYVKPEFLKAVAPVDPVKWLPQLKVPLRIQQVRENEANPMECKESIMSAAPKQAEVVRFATAKDLFTREDNGRLFRWMKDRLKEPANPAAEKTSSAVSMPVENSAAKSAKR